MIGARANQSCKIVSSQKSNDNKDFVGACPFNLKTIAANSLQIFNAFFISLMFNPFRVGINQTMSVSIHVKALQAFD
jgi:hypothetical protein